MKHLTQFLFCCLLSYQTFGQQNDFFVKFSEIPEEFSTIIGEPGVNSFDCPFKLKEMQGTFVLKLNGDRNDQILTWLQDSYSISYIEEVPDYRLFYTPNDIQAQQYNLQLTQAELAWDIDNDASDMTIAIVDDALDLNHPDIASNVWINPLEIPGNNIEEEGNGFIDDVAGWDCADNDNDVNPPVSPTMSHGTHVGGISSATTDNSNGISAIGFNAKLLPVKIGASSTGSLQNAYVGVDYAILMNADVINMSWGGGAFSATYQALFDIAYANNIVCVAAAGNSNTSALMYPASYNHVISVASTDQTDQKSSFSNYGAAIDVSAPGTDIYSTIPGGGYTQMSGTSMASPFVAGLAALMRSTNPLANADLIEMCLESTCDPVIGALASQCGSGRVNAFEAMKCISQIYADFTVDFNQACPGSVLNFTDLSYGTGLSYNWSFPGGTPATSTAQNPSVTYNTNGTYDVTLQVSDGTNSNSVTQTNYITIQEPSAVISGNSNISGSGYAPIYLNFTGNPPFDVEISDGTTTFWIYNISSSSYSHYLSASSTTNYTIVNFNDSQCNGIFSGMATVNFTPNSGSGTQCNQGATNFSKYMSSTSADSPLRICKLGQNGYLLGVNGDGGVNNQLLLTRIDLCGNIVWQKHYNYQGNGTPTGLEFINGEIYMTSYHNNPFQTSLIKLDLNGNVLTSHAFGDNYAQYPRQMIELSDGNLLFGGVSNSPAYSVGTNDFYVVKSDLNANIIWKKHLGGIANEYCHDVSEDSNGDILAVGYSRDYVGAGIRRGIVFKLDANGNLLWTKEYHNNAGQTQIFSVKEIGGFYYMSGFTNNGSFGDFDGLIIKTNLNGDIIWSKRYGTTGYDQINHVENKNGEIIFNGVGFSATAGREAMLGKIDANGNLIDYASFGTPGDDYIYIASTSMGTDNSGIYGFHHGVGGALGGNDIVCYRYTDIDSICNPSDVILNEDNISMVATVFNSTVIDPGWVFTPTTCPQIDFTTAEGFLCQNIQYTDSCIVSAGFDTQIPTCFNDSVLFIDNIMNDSLNVLYLWDFGDGSSLYNTTDTTASHLYSSAGNYNVTLVVIDTLLGCSDTAVNSISLTANPSIILTDTVTICLGDTAQISIGTDCSNGWSQIWTSAGPVIVEQYDSLIKVLPNTGGYLYLELTDGFNSIFDSVFIVEDSSCCTSYPKAETDPNALFCINNPINFVNNSISNSGLPSYYWQFLPDGTPSSSTVTNPSGVSFATDGTKQIILELTDGCGVFLDTLEINIFSDPIFDIGNSDSLCHSQMVVLGENPIGGYNYNWSPGNLFLDSTISNPEVWISGSQVYYVTVTDSWTGCSFEDSVAFLFDSTHVELFMTDTLICYGEELSFDYSNYSSSDILWSPDSQITSVDSNNITFYINETTWIIGSTISQIGCTNRDSVYVSVIEQLSGVIIDSTFCEYESFVYNPQSPWIIDGVSTSTIVLTESGDFYYEEENECNSVQHFIHLEEIVCSCELFVPNAFTPNGLDGKNDKFIPIVNCPAKDYNFSVFNRWGELIFNTEQMNFGWDGKYKGIRVQDGSYVWKINFVDPYTELPVEKTGHITVLK